MKNLLFLALMYSPFTVATDYLLNSEAKCFGHDQVPVSTQDGSCVGMIVNSTSGLKKPRKVLHLTNNHFIISDMVNWNKGNGIIWDVKIENGTPKLTKLLTGLNLPHGLRKGPDGLIYVGETDKVFRFNLQDPKGTKEVVIKDIPSSGKHPISEFIFTSDNRLILNVGAPSDQCLNDKKKPVYPCLEAKEEATLREYLMKADGSFQLLGNLAYGLRNSMGIVELKPGEIVQFNNGMDFEAEGSPMEEVNLIEPGAHYGWPYCYERGKLNKKYKRTFFNRKVPKINCSKYKNPIGLLPAHSAPLDAHVYSGEMFPEFKGKVLVSLHGYRKSGQRIVSMDLDTANKTNDTFEEVVFGWQASEGIRPKGAPVGLDIGEQGEIYFVDDKNKTLMVLAKGNSAPIIDNSNAQIIGDLKLDKFKVIQKKVLNKSCTQCHGNFKDDAKVLAKSLVESGLVKPGNSEESEFLLRVNGQSSNMAMPPVGEKLGVEEVKLIQDWIDSLE